jgi:antitoxin HigA-1
MGRTKTTETMKFHEVHPGAVLKEEVAARGLSAAAFALMLRVPPQRVQEIVAGKRGITPETALRIGTALGTGARLWLAMQQAYDLRKVEREDGDKIRAEIQGAA